MKWGKFRFLLIFIFYPLIFPAILPCLILRSPFLDTLMLVLLSVPEIMIVILILASILRSAIGRKYFRTDKSLQKEFFCTFSEEKILVENAESKSQISLIFQTDE